MKDPFMIPPFPWLAELVQPWCEFLNLPTLPLHIHEVVLSALLYSIIFWPVSPILSNLLAPEYYSRLSRKKRINWNTHVVSMVQSCIISALSIWVIAVDNERWNMDWEERVWGYTGASGMIQAMATGYFVWDLFVTSSNLDVFGIGTLAHAIAALLVFLLGFRPLVNYYSCIFILWELSTPFLNIHWFMDKVNMTGSSAQLYNGIMLLSTFFTCRIVFGTYNSYRVMGDMLRAVFSTPGLHKSESPFMAFADYEFTVPVWAALAYLGSNLTLNSLNFYWFVKMVSAVRKRFQPSKGVSEPVTEVEVDLSTVASGVPQKMPITRRKA
ncbi:TLC domain [Geosmithia morbida]|uniref:TLC domain n=1 Tax=Geosmithia morbida TaxID=1094350 RepID=A0A9P4YT93_9HYPO|nr:TLC domain [Geosmithia morbida]KAF4122385.1 TLC domain [Geosmithia morbida]